MFLKSKIKIGLDMWKYESDMIKLLFWQFIYVQKKMMLITKITLVSNLSYPGKQVIFLKQYYLIEKYCRAGVTTTQTSIIWVEYWISAANEWELKSLCTSGVGQYLVHYGAFNQAGTSANKADNDTYMMKNISAKFKKIVSQRCLLCGPEPESTWRGDKPGK